MKKTEYYEVRKIESIRDMLLSSCRIFSDRNAFLKKEKRTMPYSPVTFGEFGEKVKNLGTKFLSMGLNDKRIAVISENRFEWALTYMASACSGITIVPIDRELSGIDLKNLIKISKVSVVVCSLKISSKLENIKEENENIEYMVCMDSENIPEGYLSLYELEKEGEALISNGDTSFDEVKINPEEAKILLFTSGTTALAKGVLLSNKNIISNLMSMCRMTYVDANDVFLSVLPLHHTYECTCGMMAPLYRGSCIAYADGLKYILNNLKEAKVSVFLGVPAIFDLMYKRIWATARSNNMDKKLAKALKLSNALRKIGIDKRRSLFKSVIDSLGGHLRLLISGAAYIEPEVIKSFFDMGIMFLQGYGITECSPIVALNRDINYKDDALGLPLSCMEIKINNPDENGVGEIICRGDNVMIGYYENEEETKAVLKDGWFYTGDYGSIDKDGFLKFEGRKKNIIIAKNGKNVYPEELENFILKSDYVSECMVYSYKDKNSGEEEIHAQIFPDFKQIELKLGQNPDIKKVTELIQSVVDEVNGRNPVWKYIRKTVIREKEFEKTTTKKIKRFAKENLEK